MARLAARPTGNDNVIDVNGLGIEFYRSRRRKLSLREMVLRREQHLVQGDLLGAARTSRSRRRPRRGGRPRRGQRWRQEHPAQGHRRRAAARRGHASRSPEAWPRSSSSPAASSASSRRARTSASRRACTAWPSRPDRRALRRDRRLRGAAGRRGPRHAVPTLLLGHAGATRLRRHHDARRADRPRRRGARGRRQGLPREVLPAHGVAALRGPDALPRVALRDATCAGSAPAGSTSRAAGSMPTARWTRSSTSTTPAQADRLAGGGRGSRLGSG